MADKSVGELIAAQSVTPTDLFVLEQNGTAKKLTGQILENWLVSFADGHGGIQSIKKLSTSGLADTYRITLADTTTFDFVVNNGRGITGISKTSTSGLVDTYTISYNNGTTSKFTVTNGEKGDKGDNTYTWVKYASQEPTEESHSMGDIPDDWRGEYNGPLAEAPTDWKQYKWFKHKGEKGDTGNPATLVTKSVTYQVSDSGTIIPSGSWGSSIPVVSQGKYLWTKTEVRFNTGDPIVSYSVARMGIDGSGSVSSVAGVSPDATGNVPITASDVGALPATGGTITGPINMNGQTLSGLNAPTEDTQAANKGYVDSKVYMELLWNNGSIDSTYEGGQSISHSALGDETAYRMIMICTEKTTLITPNVVTGASVFASYTSAVNTNDYYINSRGFAVNNGSLHVRDNFQVYSSATSTAISKLNKQNKPYKIYGIKGVS